MEIQEVKYLTPPLENFEVQYKEIRNKEGRWLNDDMVKNLPFVPSNHPLKKEWDMRQWMVSKFGNYLQTNKFENALDIGSGNGWMTYKVAKHVRDITGLDVGKEELEQAARCFGSEGINFVCCSDWSLLPQEHFDLIYFAGSFHYFEPNELFWTQLKKLLKPNGEIHILETQFYSSIEVELARNRSVEYFNSLGMNVEYYKHLSWNILPEHDVLYRPGILNKLFRSRSPFPWIRIRK